MYPTFAQFSPEPHSDNDPQTGVASAADDLPTRPLRKQVSKACDWCRARRIKCDNNRPCRSCRQRGAECTNRGTNEARTLPQAMKEIDRLRARVKKLEAEVEGYKHTPSPSGSTTLPTPSDTSASTASDVTKDLRSSALVASTTKGVWQGIYIAAARSEQISYYGPSSSFYFISRIGTYIGKAFQQSCADHTMLPRGASNALVNPGGPTELEANVSHGNTPRPSMSRTQEEYFIGLFWESYYCTIPIIDEVEFRRHYASLWETTGPNRKHSALVDIIIALCLQYGSTFIPRETSSSSKRGPPYDDATISGRWYYRRCQSLLTADLESPSFTTVRCHIFSIVYLCCASFQNMAHILMAQAIRTAQLLGLHFEPPAELPQGERELRKRVWWVLYTIEAKMHMKLGRPFSMDESQITVGPPSDDKEAAALNGASLGTYGPDVTWLSYSVQLRKMTQTVLDVYRTLFDKCGSVIEEKQCGSLYKDPQALETCAEVLAYRMPTLQTWLKQVPADLKTKRRDDGEPFSLDRTGLRIDTLAPTWLQIQRIHLELMYHHMIIQLTRPFIVFSSNSGTYTPLSERHAAACVNHAIAHTLIMHQVVSETDLMTGWTEYFISHWSSTLTIIGFVLAYPIHASTPAARKALEKAIAVCDIYGANFAVAASAAGIARDLTGKADILVNRLRMGIMPGGSDEPVTQTGGQTNLFADGDDGLAFLDPSQQDDGCGAEFMDWALTVDSFNSFEHFYDTGHTGDPWASGQGFGI